MRLPAARALEHIRRGSLAPGYLLLGKQIYWRDRIWQALREASCGQDIRIAEFDLRQDAVSRAIAEAQARSLLTRRQLLLVRNSQALLSTRSGRKESLNPPATASKAADLLVVYFRDPNPDSILVLEMMDVDLDSEDWRERDKVKSRLESFGNLCEVVLLASPDFEAAVELVREAVAERERTISTPAAQQLVALFNRDIGPILMEIEKLCIYKEKSEKIDVKDIEILAAGAVPEAQLSLTAAIGSGDPRQALEALAAAASQGVYPPLILAEVARYLRQLILLKENRVRELQQGANLLWTARLPVPPAILSKLLEQARHFPDRALLEGLRLVYQAELALRSSPPDDWIILERIVLQLMPSLHTAN